MAIRSDEEDPESPKAWGVMQIGKGGYWCRESRVADWGVAE